MADGCHDYEKDIDELYDKTNKMELKMVEIDVNQKHYIETLEKVADSNDKLVGTLQSMEVAFTTMDNKIDAISKNVNGIDTRMKKIEADNQFEIMGFLKKNFPWVVVGVGILIYWASQYVKF